VCFPLCCCFCVSAGFQIGYSGRVSCSSQLVFEVFVGVHGLALIRVRFLFLLLCPPPCPGGCLCIIVVLTEISMLFVINLMIFVCFSPVLMGYDVGMVQ